MEQVTFEIQARWKSYQEFITFEFIKRGDVSRRQVFKNVEDARKALTAIKRSFANGGAMPPTFRIVKKTVITEVIS